MFDRLSSWLISKTKSEAEYNRLKIMIAISFLIIAVHTLNTIIIFLTQSANDFSLLPIAAVYVVLLIPIVPVWFSKNSLAILLFNTTFPFFLMLIGIFLGKTFGVEYSLFTFILISFYFYDKFINRFLLAIYYLLLFFIIKFGSDYFHFGIKTINESNKAFITNIIYLTTFISIFAMCQYFLSQINIYRSSKNKLLDDLSEKNLQLESAYTEMERFTYVASHDIKTPLRNISSFVGLMERDLNKGNMESIPEYLDFIKTNSQSLFFLVGDILEYSKLNSRPDEAVKIVDLNLLAQKVKSSIEMVNENSVVEIENLPTIKANPTLFKLLFQNFIENGLKYNNSSVPKVKVYAKTYENYLNIIFKDNGIGISEKYHTRIFEMFKRLHSNAQYQGTGIGLAICKKIVDQLFGNIKIESAVGNGTTFTITLPYKMINIVNTTT